MSDRVIRINKVLRELNISLERAVDYLKDRGINIDANPNAKISDKEFNILQSQFAGDKGRSIKTKEILELERHYGITIFIVERDNLLADIKLNKTVVIDRDNQIIGLNLSHCKISDLSPLKNFKNLTNLYLSDNLITDISNLDGLKELSVIDLGSNNISDFSVLNKLGLLRTLNIKNNSLTNIDFLRGLDQIEQLDMSWNKIDDISVLKNFKKLQNLNIKENKISYLKQFEFILESSLYINADCNPCFENNNIIFKENENHYNIIINELKKLKDEQFKAVLPEKMVLLGNHACGKSSLLYYLQNEKLDYNHDTTHILKIERYPKGKEEELLPKAIVYDFGGQDFYHGIYKTFLTDNSITLLLWNTQSNLNGIIPDSKQRPNRNFNVEYWLGQRKQKGISGEVLLIQTKADDVNSIKQSYINSHKEVSNDFYISLEKETENSLKSKLKHSALNYLKESIDEVIVQNQKEKNPEGTMSKPYFEFIKYILNRNSSYKSINKSDLKKHYEVNDNLRFDTDIEQLNRQGLILVDGTNVWLNPVKLTEYVHEKILNKRVIGNGIIEESVFKKNNFEEKIIELLIKQKVIFYHEYGISKGNKLQKEYIIPNYLPQISNSAVDYDLLTFGLDNPLFILKFREYLPFGLINQLVCYFGRLPDSKKFWREHLIFTIDKKVKILIELDFEHLEIKVFSIYCKDLSEDYKNEIEQYLFYIIMAMYWDFDELPENLNEYIELYKNFQKGEQETKTTNLVESLMERFYIDESCRPDDLYISKEGKFFIKYDSLCNIEDNETKIKTYTLSENRILKEYREMPVSSYQNFTHITLPTMKKIFISYSNEDYNFKKELEKHLKPINKFQLAKSWSCEEMTPGLWDEQIQDELKSSDIVVFMLSINFITSDYIVKDELFNVLLEMKNNSNKKIICVLVRDFSWRQYDKLFDLTGLDNDLRNDDIDSDKMAKAIGLLPAYQFVPYNIKGEGNEQKRFIQAIEEWDFPNKAYMKVVEEIVKIL